MEPLKRASFKKEGDRTIVHMNSSGMGLIQTCERKANFILNQEFGLNDEGSNAQIFGKMIHKAMAEYYSLEPKYHTPESILEIWTMVSHGYETLDETRTKKVGANALMSYAKQYEKDPWKVVLINGLPAVEIPFESLLVKSDEMDIYFFGTIDMIVRNTETGEYAVMDHKTGRSLGKEFIQRWKPNHQMSGYIWGLNEYFKIPTNLAIINGLQVAKTIQNACRVETRRTHSELKEFTKAVIHSSLKLVSGLEGQADGTTCSAWGGCRFLDVCSSLPELRPVMLENMKSSTQEIHDGLD